MEHHRKLFYILYLKYSKLRAVAYDRVSSDKDEQEESFERQVEYYTRSSKIMKLRLCKDL